MQLVQMTYCRSGACAGKAQVSQNGVCCSVLCIIWCMKRGGRNDMESSVTLPPESVYGFSRNSMYT